MPVGASTQYFLAFTTVSTLTHSAMFLATFDYVQALPAAKLTCQQAARIASKEYSKMAAMRCFNHTTIPLSHLCYLN